VIWDFAGELIPQNLLEDLFRFVSILQSPESLVIELKPFLRKGEIKALANRAIDLLQNRQFPQTDNTRRQFPWPPV
jgi:hypothetical protein